MSTGYLLVEHQMAKKHRCTYSFHTITESYQHDEIGQKATVSSSASLESVAIESLDSIDVVAELKTCAKQKDLHRGTRIHLDVLKHGFLESNRYVVNTLVSMYANCGAFDKALKVLDEIPCRTVVCWNALITGYVLYEQGEEALNSFYQMQCEGLFPNAVTYTCILKACGSIKAVNKGQQIHNQIDREGLLCKDVLLGNALIDMYAKCGVPEKAAQVLEKLPIRTIVSWSALIAGYVQLQQGKEALKCFDQMLSEGSVPNAVTFICVLEACGLIGAIEKGEQVHEELIRQGLLGKDVVLGTALVDMYVKCRALAKAQLVLDKLPVRNVVSWNALITGYIEGGHFKEVLHCFKRMYHESILPDTVTFICVLKACGSMGAIKKGKQVHNQIVKQGLLEGHVKLGAALVDMYVKCGMLAKAQQLLYELSVTDLVTWGALIAGYAHQGQGVKAVKCFKRLEREGLTPDASTLACVLNACSHSGLLHEGQKYFEKMSSQFNIEPSVEHYTCMVDLYGRAGDFVSAVAIIKKMPFTDYLPVWNALLGACQKWGNVDLGRSAFDHAIQVNKNNRTAYICMTNIYADAGMQLELDKVKALGIKYGVWKKAKT